jgi:hypothetical protein
VSPGARSLPEAGAGPDEWDAAPQPLLSSESTEWDAIPNLDDFFRRIYKCAARPGPRPGPVPFLSHGRRRAVGFAYPRAAPAPACVSTARRAPARRSAPQTVGARARSGPHRRPPPRGQVLRRKRVPGHPGLARAQPARARLHRGLLGGAAAVRALGRAARALHPGRHVRHQRGAARALRPPRASATERRRAAVVCAGRGKGATQGGVAGAAGWPAHSLLGAAGRAAPSERRPYCSEQLHVEPVVSPVCCRDGVRFCADQGWWRERRLAGARWPAAPQLRTAPPAACGREMFHKKSKRLDDLPVSAPAGRPSGAAGRRRR